MLRGATIIETLISMLIISILMLLFAYVVFNVFKLDLQSRNEVNCQLRMDQIADSVKLIPFEQWQDFQLDWTENGYIAVDKEATATGLHEIEINAFQGGELICTQTLLRYE